ncbi:MAG: M23 family metallopeptidase [Clostridia bacterium]|nr:M23 family metallopeptidase [Clostridia bacterium]
MTNASKKQNRILLATLALVLTALIVLVALTSSANRKAKAEAEAREPVPGSRVEDRAAEEPDGIGSANDAEDAVKTEKEDESKVPETEAVEEQVKTTGKEKGEHTEEEEDAAVNATVGPEEMLPVFRAPIEGGVVVKGCSLTVPVFSATMNDYRVHRGLDFACAPGTPVLAAADGVVTEVRRDPMMGVTVVMRHSGDAETTYQGLDEHTNEIAHPGDRVAAGQVIGASGETALIESAEENHLHFSMTVAGKPVDPGEFMEVTQLSELYEDTK